MRAKGQEGPHLLPAGQPARSKGPTMAKCAICGSRQSFLDEIITDDRGGRMFVCSDSDYCARRVREQEDK